MLISSLLFSQTISIIPVACLSRNALVDKEGVHIQVSYFLFSGGKFGAYMQVMIENDGPVTINIDSRKE